ncbi:SMI1/KNR4 family protein [Streptomyces sp. enrichment culture]|uniref:SMI1/KNR4 family protein n=1 Tax=Streptomyces sp. enrichment culture TaxID=1795815 RepID=UPI003F559F9B
MTQKPGDDRRLPPALADLARVGFDYDGGEGIDFEPYDAFDSADETTDWFRHWTGNHDLDGDAYRVFGQDGSGGLAAVWLARPGRTLAEQPVVFLGSEGESGVVAGNVSDFLWVLADGVGPLESVLYEAPEPRPSAPRTALTEVAERHATTPRRPARTLITEARAEFPAFTEDLDELCR